MFLLIKIFQRIKREKNNFFFNLKLYTKKYNIELSLKNVKSHFTSLNEEYLYFHLYFKNLSPEWLKAHRYYFSKEQRGFGEDAFHAMWYFVFYEFSPSKILEIGVYRGQTLSLFSLISNKFKIDSEIHGISPFTSSADKVSSYIGNLNYYEDVKANFNYFQLPIPYLHKGFSTDNKMVEIIKSKSWDLIYIDGNHDYEVVKADFEVCSQCLAKNGILVIDDASLLTDYKPFYFSTGGHIGPSKLASEIDLNLFEEILYVGHNRVYRKR